VSVTRDQYGFNWVTCDRPDRDLTKLMIQLHGVNTVLSEAGLGPSLLCTVVGFVGQDTHGAERRLGLVYLYKRGTIYPFAPMDGQRRDTTVELEVRAELAEEVPMESDLERWFPLWDAPVP